jgi:salicylate hydroxylase
LVLGAGIAGLALAQAWHHQGLDAHHPLRLIEQSEHLAEVGAGIQLGPNATRRLLAWGLGPALAQAVCVPQALEVRNQTGEVVGVLPLGQSVTDRYGAPYWCVHRGDLHQALREAVLSQGLTQLSLNSPITGLQLDQQRVWVQTGSQGDAPPRSWPAEAVLAADGVWSLAHSTLRPHAHRVNTGQVAYRSLLPMSEVPCAWQDPMVRVWMLERCHVVMYPVQAGRTLNVVVLLRQTGSSMQPAWEQRPEPQAVQAAMDEVRARCPSPLQSLLNLVPDWRAWPLVAANPLDSPQAMAMGRVALLGDAAHPMLPYLGQGAGMAIEDADSLAHCAQSLGPPAGGDWSSAWAAYAEERWVRCARVQRKAQRNGEWFHAKGVRAWLRDLGLRWQAQAVMDVPWLYRG